MLRKCVKNLLRTLNISREGRFITAQSMIVGFFCAIAVMLVPRLIGRAIDVIVPNSTDFDKFWSCVLTAILFIIVSGFLQFVLGIINTRLINNITYELRNKCYKKISRLSMKDIDKLSEGNIKNMIINDVSVISNGMLLFLNQFMTGIISILVVLIVMFMISFKITMCLIIFTPITFLVSYFITSSTYSLFKKQADIRKDETIYLNDVTGNFVLQKAYDINDTTFAKFNEINEKFRKISVKATFFSSITNPTTRFINAIIYAIIIYIGINLCLNSSSGFTIGTLAATLVYASQFMKPFNELSSVFTELNDSFASMERIYDFLGLEELSILQIDEKSQTQVQTKVCGTYIDDNQFNIEFRNVTFSYKDGYKVLDNVSFKIENGEKCAIVGPTGCGKTTIINLLMRFYEPDSGEILINGQNISDISYENLREKISMVSQDTWFNLGSVKDIISYKNSELTDNEIINYAKQIGSWSFIRQLPHKLYTDLSNESVILSEGQRQLLSITRTMASNPDIVILDEATSNIDVYSEVKIQKAFKTLLDGKTGIIIAHRLSTIKDSDYIIVLSEGKVVQSGNHEELISKEGLYKNLYEAGME